MDIDTLHREAKKDEFIRTHGKSGAMLLIFMVLLISYLLATALGWALIAVAELAFGADWGINVWAFGVLVWLIWAFVIR